MIDPETGNQLYGSYLVVEVHNDGLDIEMRSIRDFERVDCDRHGQRGVQFNAQE